jgi:hypothetical protein
MEETFTLSQILDYGRALAHTDQQTKEIIKNDISDGNEECTNYNRITEDLEQPVSTRHHLVRDVLNVEWGFHTRITRNVQL